MFILQIGVQVQIKEKLNFGYNGKPYNMFYGLKKLETELVLQLMFYKYLYLSRRNKTF